MMSALIIGSNGYIGRHLSALLAEEQSPFQNFDLQEEAIFGQPCYQTLDIRDRNSFDRLSPEVECIYFLAGLTGTEASFAQYEDFANSNFIGLLHLLDWMKQTSCKAKILFPSTRLVYQGQKDTLLREDSPKEARTIYAVTKLAAEQALEAYAQAFGISYTILRICVPYGQWVGESYSYGTIGFMMNQAKMNQAITLFGDGSQKRTFTHIEDICQIVRQAASSTQTSGGIYNIGGEHMSLADVASMIAEKYDVPVRFAPWPGTALLLESGDTMFDDTKLKTTGIAFNKNNLSKYLFNIDLDIDK